MSTEFSVIKSECERGFRVLGADYGYDQNCRDLSEWLQDGYINKSEYSQLLKWNRETWRNLIKEDF